MSRKKKKLINLLVDDKATSGPAPDAELTSVGQDMFWVPAGYQVESEVKPKIKDEEDPMLNIL